MIPCVAALDVDTFKRQVLKRDSDIKGSADVVPAAQRMCLQCKQSGQDVDGDVGTPAELLKTQLFKQHNMHFLSDCFRNQCMFETETNVTVVKWSEKWQGQLYGLGVEMMLAGDCGALGDVDEVSK